MVLGQLRMGARQAKNAPLVFDTLNCTWSFSYSALHLVDPLHVGRVKKLSGLASGGHRRLQHLAIPTLQLFTSELFKFNIFASTTMHEFHLSPKRPLNPNWLSSNIKGRAPEGTWGTAKPRSNSKLLGSPDHQVNWLAGSVQNSNTWWISQKVDLYCPMLILDSQSKII